MSTSKAREVVDRYFTALKGKDFTAMRELLHEDISFVGPMGTTATADAYIEALRQVTAPMKSVERHALFAEGEDVCQIYDLILTKPAVTLPVAQWLKVRGDKIATVRLYFDARPLA